MRNSNTEIRSKFDIRAKSVLRRHPGESRGPGVVPTKGDNHLKGWIPVFTGMTNFMQIRLFTRSSNLISGFSASWNNRPVSDLGHQELFRASHLVLRISELCITCEDWAVKFLGHQRETTSPSSGIWTRWDRPSCSSLFRRSERVRRQWVMVSMWITITLAEGISRATATT
jgi:hypothetical protein